MANYFNNWAQGVTNQGLAQGNQIQGEGQDLYNQLGGQAAYDQGMAQNYGGYSDQAWGVGSGGPQGYTSSQAAGILGMNSDGSGLQGVSPLSQSQINGFQLTPQQQSSIMGNPNGVAQNVAANNDQLGTYMMQNSGALQNAAQNGQSLLSGAVNPSQFDQSPGYQQSLRGALGQEASTLNGATNNPNLGLSNQFSQNYTFTPKDQQNIVDAAGLTAGGQFQSMSDTAARQAAAAGNTSPLAIAALQQDQARQGANAASQAMINAQIAAKQQQLGVTQTAEQMRLGTSQDISSRQMQAGESLAGTQIGAANSQEGLRLQGLGAGQGLALNAAGQAANLGITGAQDVANLQSQNTQFATNANLAAGQYADTAGSNRAAQLGLNQQQVAQQGQQAQYTQGMGVNNTISNRNQTVADQYQQQQGAYRGMLTNQQQYNQGQTSNAFGQQTGALGAQTNAYNATQTNAQRGIANAYGMQQPSIWNKLGGAAISAIGAVAGAGGF